MAVSNVAVQRESVVWSQVWKGALLATIVSVIGNVLVYYLGLAIGAIPPNYEVQPGQFFSVAPVVIFSIIGLLGATIVFALLARLARRPVAIFRIVALVVLVVSFISPVIIFQAGQTGFGIALELMHVIAGMAALYFFGPYQRRV